MTSRPQPSPKASAWAIAASMGALAGAWVAGPLGAQSVGEELSEASGERIYQAACANCHGAGGQGEPSALLGFDEPLPDFTDCDFAAREPDADWVAVAHEGGPVRGFSEMMPAFRGALSVPQLERVMGYVRTLCTDPEWPRGELNLPRALVTEKAYPEDEWVVELGAGLEGRGDVEGAFVYEQRFGPRSQWEVVIPYAWSEGARNDWASGLGDVVLGVKHALHHSLASGTIASVGAELALPTGDHGKGFGAAGAEAELFGSFGALLPRESFVQAQVGGGLPLHGDGDPEAFGRVVLGTTVSSGPWGRGWSPMVEAVAERDLTAGALLHLDLVPQLQVSLNTRQHVLANVGVVVPAVNARGRSVRLLAYVLLDWFDGGFFEGW